MRNDWKRSDLDDWDYGEDHMAADEPYVGFDEKRDCDRTPVTGIVVDQCRTNPNYRYYSVRVPIQGYYIWKADGNFMLDDAKGHPTLAALEQTPGIQSMMLWEGYQINVTKASAFAWDEIEPAILDILQGHNAVEKLQI